MPFGALLAPPGRRRDGHLGPALGQDRSHQLARVRLVVDDEDPDTVERRKSTGRQCSGHDPAVSAKAPPPIVRSAFGGNHVDVVGLQPQAVGHGDDRHDRGPGQDFGELALVPGVEVLDQHECHAGVGGELSQKLAEGLEPAGGGADADDRERRSC